MDVAGFNRASELLAKFHGLLVERSESVVHSVDIAKLEQQTDDYIKNLNYSKSIDPKQAKTKTDIDGDGEIPISTDNAIDDKQRSDYKVLDEQGKVCS